MIKMLCKYYKKHIGLLILDIVCTLIYAAIDIVYPFITKKVINGEVGTVNKLIWVGVILLIIYLVRYGANFIVGYFGHVLGINIESDMRQDLFNKFEQMDYQYFDDKKTGELLANLTSHLNEISEASHHSLEEIISSFFIIIGSLIVCLIVNPLLTGIVSIGIIILLVFTILRRKRLMNCFRKTRIEQGELSSKIASSLTGIQLTKAFNNEEFEEKHFETINDDYRKARLKQVYEIGIFNSTTSFINNMVNLILLIAGGIMFIEQGEEFLPELVMFFLYVGFLVNPIKVLANTFETTQHAWSGYEKFYNIMIIENKIKSKENALVIDSLKGKIEFKDVSFKYKEDTKDVLNNFSLVIESGKKIAIVGETGVGKSTISKIIPRFYDVQKGNILIDNIDIKDYDVLSLRKQIGHIQQDVFIFYGSIADNIRYGKPDATMDEIITAAKKAAIDDFVDSLPDGYETLCGERGIQLSGGQKQRIAIARIFLKNPQILILDEATSALDNITEKAIQKSFDELSKGKTTMIIAHRLTTIKNADLIVVLGKDGILESGTHEELMNKKGYYEHMYNASLDIDF